MGRRVKRIFDITVAVTGLIIASPLLLIVAVLVWATMGRPILFWHTRPGYKTRPVSLVKFRTMRPPDVVPGRRQSDHELFESNAERVTRVGLFLRRTSLDELPQLWSVLKGDLSLVGPRPLLMQYIEFYTPEQRRRHDVPPGLTGLAQIHGRADPLSAKFKYDLEYVDNWSFWLDLKILALTPIALLSQKLNDRPDLTFAMVDDVGLYPHGPRHDDSVASDRRNTADNEESRSHSVVNLQ
jgi:sugar transferase EpsL